MQGTLPLSQVGTASLFQSPAWTSSDKSSFASTAASTRLTDKDYFPAVSVLNSNSLPKAAAAASQLSSSWGVTSISQSNIATESRSLREKPLSKIVSSSTVFTEMTVDEALEYLRLHQNDDPSAEKVKFVHCLSRYHIDPTVRHNFYDLYILEKPGHPKSDQVWNRIHRSDRLKQGVFAGKLMQLSLQGLILDEHHDERYFGGNPPIDGAFIPLDDFLRDRETVNILLTMGFFRYFRERKVFEAWQRYARRRVFQRRLRYMSEHTILADAPLVRVLQDVYAIVSEMLTSIDMFEYVGSGLINCSAYVQAQEQKYYYSIALIKKSVLKMGALIDSAYKFTISTEFLGKQIDDIIVHHPYSQTGGSTDWGGVRGIQRLKSEYKSKIGRIFMVASFMADHAVGNILKQLLVRLSKSIQGVHIANRDPLRNVVGFWVIGEADVAKDVTSSLGQLDYGNDNEFEAYSNRVDIGDQTIRKGRYLNINSQFYVGDSILDPDTNLNMKNTSKLRIAVSPSTHEILHFLQKSFGVLGTLLSLLPKLKQHPLIYKRERTIDPLTEELGPVKKIYDPWQEEIMLVTAKSEMALVQKIKANLDPGSSSVNSLYTYLQNSQLLTHMGLPHLSMRCIHEVTELMTFLFYMDLITTT